MTARFLSKRFNTDRMYKSNFQATPSETPVLDCEVYGTPQHVKTTVCWVSWNGDTETRHWRFVSGSQQLDGLVSQRQNDTISVVAKTGFETRTQVQGHISAVYAEALNEEGRVLATTELCEPRWPGSWPVKYEAQQQSEMDMVSTFAAPGTLLDQIAMF